jgi:hypothetical protein
MATLKEELVSLVREMVRAEEHERLRLEAEVYEKQCSVSEAHWKECNEKYEAEQRAKAVTVGRLIEILSEFPKDALVWAHYEDTIPLQAESISIKDGEVLLDIDGYQYI